MSGKWIRRNLFIGGAGLLLSTTLLAAGIPFFKTWYYCLAWWPLLLTVDSLNFRLTGDSPLARGAGPFLLKALVSVSLWLLFELFNLRLQNWSYHSLPESHWERWLGYSIAFASVIPAIAEFSLLTKHFIPRIRGLRKPIVITPAALAGSAVLGISFLGLNLLWPGLFFPLVWLGFIFLVDPVNYRTGRPSLWRDLESGKMDRLVHWGLAGLVMGGLWEFLNFWAGGHWRYSLPYLDFGRIFQMPVFGYLGFIPFALEVFVLWQLFLFLKDRWRKHPVFRAAGIAGLLLFDFWAFHLIDVNTVL